MTPVQIAFSRMKGAVNAPKRDLMDLVRGLRRDGCNRKADSLETIIARLEDWQKGRP